MIVYCIPLLIYDSILQYVILILKAQCRNFDVQGFRFVLLAATGSEAPNSDENAGPDVSRAPGGDSGYRISRRPRQRELWNPSQGRGNFRRQLYYAIIYCNTPSEPS